jgi:hypothetical protein
MGAGARLRAMIEGLDRYLEHAGYAGPGSVNAAANAAGTTPEQMQALLDHRLFDEVMSPEEWPQFFDWLSSIPPKVPAAVLLNNAKRSAAHARR